MTQHEHTKFKGTFKERMVHWYHGRFFWWIVIPSVVLLTALYALFFLNNPAVDKRNPTAAKTHMFIVPPNATMQAVADSLRAAGYLRSEITFRAAAKMLRAGHKLHPGTFELNRGADNLALIKDLIGDKYQVIFHLKVYEGYRLKDVAEQAAVELGLNKEEVIRSASDPNLLRQLGVPAEAPTAEGFLYPDEYKWIYPVNGQSLVQALVTRFHQMIPDTLLAAGQARGLNPYQVVTIASIVSGETKDTAEQYLVASVYENRYRIGMKLQADPTVQYGLQLDRPITHADIMKMTTYNTYLQKGLPPTPINNPSRNAIIAAVYPAVTDYLFFVAKGDGSRTHNFSATYAEHVSNITKYHNGGRSPAPSSANMAAARSRSSSRNIASARSRSGSRNIASAKRSSSKNLAASSTKRGLSKSVASRSTKSSKSGKGGKSMASGGRSR